MNLFTEQIKILCVDDEPNVLRSLLRVFLDDDYEIVIAESGDEGLRILQESGPFQVIVSDYRMPEMNGVEFLKLVYQRWPETVRIILSGYADVGAIVSAINEGRIYKFIPKPWNDQDVRVTINNCLERYFLLKNNKELLQELNAANKSLEEKVRMRTEELELSKRGLEFAHRLLANLPVGVAKIDANGMIAYCNDIAVARLKNICDDVIGGDVASCCDAELGRLVEHVRRENNISVTTQLGHETCRVVGRTTSFDENGSIVLVFMDSEA